MAMVNERQTHLGCSMTTFYRSQSGPTKCALFTCNYSYNNVIFTPIYQHGTAASKCKTGKDNEYENLCSTDEFYNVNDPNDF